jgi:uncharacterized protein YdhG (YjbR/CyaY superfamily)
MKKKTNRAQSGNQTGRASPQTVIEYLARTPEPGRSVLKKMRTAIRSVVPRDSKEILCYGIPALQRKKVLVWYAAFAKHCSLFPANAVIAEFRNELKGHKVSKGTIQFPLDRPLPIPLIKKIVKARVRQVEAD